MNSSVWSISNKWQTSAKAEMFLYWTLELPIKCTDRLHIPAIPLLSYIQHSQKHTFSCTYFPLSTLPTNISCLRTFVRFFWAKFSIQPLSFKPLLNAFSFSPKHFIVSCNLLAMDFFSFVSLAPVLSSCFFFCSCVFIGFWVIFHTFSLYLVYKAIRGHSSLTGS